jgi:hypothetical protein
VIESRRSGGPRTSFQDLPRTDSLLSFNGSSALTKLVTTLTEWMVILQGVAEDRECDRPNVKCRCCKAVRIQEELGALASKLNNAQQICERVGRIGEDAVDEISQLVQNLATMLRSEVSILIPTLGRADPMVAEQARWLVQDNDPKNCASEAVEGVITLVVRLLGVESCRTCKPNQSSNTIESTWAGEGGPMLEVGGGGNGGGGRDGDVDMDILNLVAGMCTGYTEPAPTTNTENEKDSGLREIGRQVLEKSRKRKQERPVRHQSPTSISKTRKVDSCLDPLTAEANVVHLLEKKKKGVKKDGLYKFVLWREALRDEKAKVSD